MQAVWMTHGVRPGKLTAVHAKDGFNNVAQTHQEGDHGSDGAATVHNQQAQLNDPKAQQIGTCVAEEFLAKWPVPAKETQHHRAAAQAQVHQCPISRLIGQRSQTQQYKGHGSAGQSMKPVNEVGGVDKAGNHHNGWPNKNWLKA